MKSTDLHYAAGLLEGEGSFWAGPRKGRNRPNFSICARMTDREPLARIQDIFGGKIVGPFIWPSAPRKNKPLFSWSEQKADACKKIAEKIYPFMSQRRQQQIDELLDCHLLRKILLSESKI